MEPTKEKDKPLRNVVLDILEKEQSLTAKQIYYTIKKNSSKHLTYQAVFKCLKEMQKKDMLISDKKAYKINIDWLFGVREGIEKKIQTYMLKEMGSENFDSPPGLRIRAFQFVHSVGPKAEEYLGDDKGIIVMVASGAEAFGNGLYHYLLNKNKQVNRMFIDRFDRQIAKKNVEGRKLIVVDSGIHTGRTYNSVMSSLNKLKKKYKIKDIKYAVYYDRAGIADWSCPNAYEIIELNV